MKSSILASIFAISSFSSVVTFAADVPSADELSTMLTGSQAATATKVILADPERQPPHVLFLAAQVALGQGHLEDSAFLFYAGQLRTHFERACFPPLETGGDDPFVLYDALSFECGQVVNPAVMAAPKEFAGALARLKKWNPQADENYDPGYRYSNRTTQAEAQAAVAERRTKFLARMEDLSSLFLMPEYSAAFRTLQGYNFDDGAASEAAAQTAEATMRRIEQETGLKGVFAD